MKNIAVAKIKTKTSLSCEGGEVLFAVARLLRLTNDDFLRGTSSRSGVSCLGEATGMVANDRTHARAQPSHFLSLPAWLLPSALRVARPEAVQGVYRARGRRSRHRALETKIGCFTSWYLTSSSPKNVTPHCPVEFSWWTILEVHCPWLGG